VPAAAPGELLSPPAWLPALLPAVGPSDPVCPLLPGWAGKPIPPKLASLPLLLAVPAWLLLEPAVEGLPALEPEALAGELLEAELLLEGDDD